MKSNHLRWWHLPFLLFLILGTIYIVRSSNNTPYQRNEGKIFGTFYHLTYQSKKDLHQPILDELQKVDDALSMFNDTSIISKINRNEAVKTNKFFENVFKTAKRISQETDGAFDITVAPLVNLWGFGFKHAQEPSQAALDSIMPLIGWQKVTLSQHEIKKENPKTMLDCSAIAKGYACDVVALLLQRYGVENYMIEIGGEIVTRGHNPERSAWRVGVEKPTEDSVATTHQIAKILQLNNRAMATSGNYRNFYYKNGKKYAHTINPKTGKPVQHSLLSATVLAPSCAEADAYATSFMVMGLEKAQNFLKNHTQLHAIFIYDDGNEQPAMWYSPQLSAIMTE